jgi:REP element-mobilizing transposase RayT
MLFRYRRYLPHLETQDATYFVTFRLEGSVPAKVVENWKSERDEILNLAVTHKRPLSEHEKRRLKYLFCRKIDDYIDKGHGDCWLKNPVIAQLVVKALRYFDSQRYYLHAWCVMPNHVHVVFTVISNGDESDSDLDPILHSWKSFTAHEANKILRRMGKFWQGEYYDHLIRCDEDFGHSVDYTLENPIKAGLCIHWYQWPWSGCSEKIRLLLNN